MFDQKKYVNEYNKNNYKSYKLRVRKDDDEVVEKLSSVNNLNSYILGLVRKDIKDSHKYNYINGGIKIDFPLSQAMKNLIEVAEQGDRDDDYGLYMNYADAIDTQAKNEVKRGKLTDEQWIILNKRFPV